VRAAHAVVVAFLSTVAGCGPYIAQYVATDGTVRTENLNDDQPDVADMQTVKASGAHDLKCPLEQMTAGHAGRNVIADGCGQRAVYSMTCVGPRWDDPGAGDGKEPPGSIGPSTDSICRLRLISKIEM
jgi:hypothetical protein